MDTVGSRHIDRFGNSANPEIVPHKDRLIVGIRADSVVIVRYLRMRMLAVDKDHLVCFVFHSTGDVLR